MDGVRVLAAAVSLHHVSRTGGGGDGAGLELVAGARVIAWLKELKFGQEYRDRAEEGGDLKARILSKKARRRWAAS